MSKNGKAFLALLYLSQDCCRNGLIILYLCPVARTPSRYRNTEHGGVFRNDVGGGGVLTIIFRPRVQFQLFSSGNTLTIVFKK